MESLFMQSISFSHKATYMQHHYDNFAICLTQQSSDFCIAVKRRNSAEIFFDSKAMVLPWGGGRKRQVGSTVISSRMNILPVLGRIASMVDRKILSLHTQNSCSPESRCPGAWRGYTREDAK